MPSAYLPPCCEVTGACKRFVPSVQDNPMEGLKVATTAEKASDNKAVFRSLPGTRFAFCYSREELRCWYQTEDALMKDAILWLIWIPSSLILLVLMINSFIIS